MDTLARFWQWIGCKFERRPMAVIGLVLGAVIFASGLTYILVSQHDTAQQIKKVQNAFCNGQAPYTKTIETNCHKLMDQLLRHPTKEQADRLRQIIKENP